MAHDPIAASATHTAARPRRLTFLNLALVFLMGLFVARLPSTLAQIRGGSGDFWGPVREVQNLLSSSAVAAPDQDKLRQGAIEGMLEALDDQYAEFIPPADAKEFEKQMSGTFVGIGCQVEMRDGWLTVISPLEDSPALNAGVMAGDRITDVDGKSTFGLTVDECIKMLTGEPGTKVSFTVQRDGRDIPVTVTRARIVSRSVRGFRRDASGTGRWDYLIDPERRVAYIRMSQFTPTSPRELREAVQEARDAAGGELSGLIFDLRNNPGGYMDAAIRIADLFLTSGRIMSVRGRTNPEVVFAAEASGEHYDFPVLVMVNQASASASEIVSGAIQDNDRGVVLGTRTFGKGLVQSVHPLTSLADAQVKFTTQKYYLPSGRLIQRTDEATVWGVDPSPGFFVPMSDPEQVAWILLRRDWDVIRADGQPAREGQEFPPPPAEQRWTDPEWIASVAKDKQLGAAVRAVQSRLESGAWKGVSGEADEHGKIAVAELNTLTRLRERMSKEFMRIEKRIDTLEKVAATGKGTDQMPDLWADKVDPTGGKVRVVDRDGRLLVELDITGRDVERWIAAGDIRVVPGTQAEPPPAPAQPKDAAKASEPSPTPVPATTP
jgi:carboxyl-terminal processing protease